ncbi:hypothetical protein OG889_40555 [Streptomyces sp. NBC_00481]|uniref:hypothetical protein n=1 Tax=unclassified Streptomyces TaxID=2593676 RepID=UPI002DDC165F|nr:MULTISPECIES: hypothetical protein [unclassified Streptomyces]WRZ00424.1 hypothetical protein OG889_40555 [Streptomyces sp. NBC_00481]
MPSVFVLGVQQELRELVDGSAGTGDVAGDGCRDPVPMLGRALTVRAQDQGPAVGSELGVTARRVTAGEVPNQNEIACSWRQIVKAQSLACVNECRGEPVWWVLCGTAESSRKDRDATQAR